MGKLIILAALLLSGGNLVPAETVLTTLVSNLGQPNQDDYELTTGKFSIQAFTTGDSATLRILELATMGGVWDASNAPTISLLNSGRSIVASFVYASNIAPLINYDVQGGSYALQATTTYYIQVEGGSGYLDVTTSPSQSGLPGWAIGDLHYIGVDSSASATSPQILKFSLSGVPEPATSSLLVIGLGLFALARRRSRA